MSEELTDATLDAIEADLPAPNSSDSGKFHRAALRVPDLLSALRAARRENETARQRADTAEASERQMREQVNAKYWEQVRADNSNLNSLLDAARRELAEIKTPPTAADDVGPAELEESRQMPVRIREFRLARSLSAARREAAEKEAAAYSILNKSACHAWRQLHGAGAEPTQAEWESLRNEIVSFIEHGCIHAGRAFADRLERAERLLELHRKFHADFCCPGENCSVCDAEKVAGKDLSA